MKFFRLFLLLFVGASLITTGCTETEIECKKRYIQSVTIQSLPSGIDLFSEPDLRCDITPNNSNYWSYASNSVDNVSGLPLTISFPSGDILLTEEKWAMRLIDEDAFGDDIIYEGTFQPYNASEGTITFSQDGVNVLTLNYFESE